MSLCKYILFEWLHDSFVVLLYHFILGESDFLQEIFPQSYPWSPNYLENFRISMLLIEVSKCWKIVEFSKISIQMKHLKTLNGTQTTSRLKKLPSPPPPPPPTPDKSLLCLSKKKFTEIYRNILAFIFQVLPEWSSWTSRNGAVQMFFWQKPETCLLENL